MKKSSKIAIIIAIVAVLAIVGIIIGIVVTGGNENTPRKMSKEEMLKVAKPITNKQIVADFEVNEKNARDKYKDNIFTYTGIVKEVGDNFVALDNAKMYSNDHKEIYLSDAELKTLQKDEKITVVGKIKSINAFLSNTEVVYMVMEEAYLVSVNK